MSWGDPYEKLYKGSSDARRARAVSAGLTTGALINYGLIGRDGQLISTSTVNPGFVMVWRTLHDIDSGRPADIVYVRPGIGIIMGVDCESDEIDDWVMVLLGGNQNETLCWIPASNLRVL